MLEPEALAVPADLRARRLRRPALAVIVAVVCAGALWCGAQWARHLVRVGIESARARVEARLGRRVVLDGVTISFGWTVQVSARAIEIGPRPGATGAAATALFRSAAVHIQIPIWPVIRSRGHLLAVRELPRRFADDDPRARRCRRQLDRRSPRALRHPLHAATTS